VIENDPPPTRLIGSQVLENINKINFNSTHVEGFGDDHNWTKKVFFGNYLIALQIYCVTILM
jgi:hypothetical protein